MLLVRLVSLQAYHIILFESILDQPHQCGLRGGTPFPSLSEPEPPIPLPITTTLGLEFPPFIPTF